MAKHNPSKDGHQDARQDLCKKVGAKEARKIRARHEKYGSVWFGLGMFGLVGWSVAIPTLAGIALGVWIDLKWPSRYSWTLMLLVIGIILGCLNAWFWVMRERKMIQEEKEEPERG
ncbi:MAG: AtpZ/AtpI family protein [Deltaproteobacteria bacterium]|jgi:ATP synthase protein I|nr:AtpZ/AtpI family protein [Deltaproteobacteria bacterium]